MVGVRRQTLVRSSATLMVWASLSTAACASRTPSRSQAELTDLARGYAVAWSSQDPDSLAAFYSEDGSLRVNAGAPSVGRAAVRTTAQGYMAAPTAALKGSAGRLPLTAVRTPLRRNGPAIGR